MGYDDQLCVKISMLCLYSLLLVAPCISTFVCENYNDCKALLKFKKGITSDPNGHLEAWNEANPFCNWTGVTCHEHVENRVVVLELSDMGLQGSLSPFLFNLSLLAKLLLHTNRFHGEIPTSFGELSKLVHLNLSENQLQGKIPSSLHRCRSLKFMDLTDNNLSGIPEEIGLMKSLTYLSLTGNVFTGSIPSFLSNLTELTRLELSYNYFTGEIPPELGELKKLEIMYLHVNNLEGSIPSALSNCTALREISLIGNQLSGEIPPELGSKLRNLQKMYLQMNKLSGKIPVTISNLSQLILLDLSMNKLEGEVPKELGMLENLEILYLHSNDLISGSDNSSLSFLTSLTNCSHLKKLHLASCLFVGKLPDSVGDLSKELYYLNIRDNSISGKIPESIGNLSSLVDIDLWYNFFDETLPAALGKLEKLQRLSLGKNRLHGQIPDDIGKMANLGLLDLNTNLISGSIPPSLCTLPQLRYLYLSHNRLSGKFPIELTQCSLLMLLDLSYNRLRGSIPPQIGSFPNLALSLNLSNNGFIGSIPETIGKLVSLESIDLSKNNFSGVIPSAIEGCISLIYLNFSNNVLQGPIPESLKLITDLEVLDLTRNQLNGTIPAWIGDKDTIKTLNLSYNRLSGEVPKTRNFSFFNRSSFLGNLGLCGGSSTMGLPPCEIQHQKHKKKKVFYVILAVIPSCVLLLLVAFIIWYFFLREKYKKQGVIPTAFPTIHGRRIYTQRELEIATAGFNEANLLGRGGFGSVYKATMHDGRTTVAVKVLHEESAGNYKNLKREFKILSQIKHRNLVGMLGSTWNPQFKALVLEFIPNGNLDQHLYPGESEEEETSELTMKERLSIAIDAANGLQYLQEGCPTQVVHCDLKPQNVLLDNDMVAHIADFGIGKLLLDRTSEQASTTDFLRGSVGYIAPGMQYYLSRMFLVHEDNLLPQ